MAPIQSSNIQSLPANAGNPEIVANLILRVTFAILGTLLCWVPFQMLYRNGEFAALVLIVDVALLNLITVVNSLLWGSDSWASWWPGYGLCDLEVYILEPLHTIFATCVMTIMRHLAQKVGAMRTSRLDNQEKTREILIQAAIIFPVPVVQIAFTYFDLAARYQIGTLIGCSADYDNSWPKVMVYDVPPVLYAVAAAYYAVLTWKRYRAVSAGSCNALVLNSAASARAQRTRRRLYHMLLCVLVPYLPIMLAYLASNVQDTVFNPYNFWTMHNTDRPYPWRAIVFVPSWLVPFPVMNQPWIPILTTIPIVAFFGWTREGIDMYRRHAAAIGLGRCWSMLTGSAVVGRRFGDTSTNKNSDESGRDSHRGFLRGTTRSSTDDPHNLVPILPISQTPALPGSPRPWHNPRPDNPWTAPPQSRPELVPKMRPAPTGSKRRRSTMLRQSVMVSSGRRGRGPLIPPRRSSLHRTLVSRVRSARRHVSTLPAIPPSPVMTEVPLDVDQREEQNSSAL